MSDLSPIKAMGRRSFLRGAAAVAAAPVALRVADNAAIDELIGDDMRRMGIEGVTRAFAGDFGQPDPEWIADSAKALAQIAKFGGSMKAPPELVMALTPEDRERLASLDLRVRRLARLHSMSDAARDAYAPERPR